MVLDELPSEQLQTPPHTPRSPGSMRSTRLRGRSSRPTSLALTAAKANRQASDASELDNEVICHNCQHSQMTVCRDPLLDQDSSAWCLHMFMKCYLGMRCSLCLDRVASVYSLGVHTGMSYHLVLIGLLYKATPMVASNSC